VRRYFVWSLAFHAVFLFLGAVIAPLRGFSGSSRPTTVINVGLVDFADPGKVKGGGPKPPVPEPAEDEVIAKSPVVNEEPAEIKAPEKTKIAVKKTKESDTKKIADRPSKKDTAKTTSPQLALNDTGGVTGSLTEGDGGGDIWGVETGANVNPYHRQGFATIRGNWRNPTVGPEGRLCVVTFRVKRNGEISDIQVEKKSGSDLFDRAALRAVQVTAAWPAFPSHWEEDEQLIHLEFQYRP
jgi:TonB family protein